MQVSTDPRRLSIASSVGSLSDDLVFATPRKTTDTGYAYDAALNYDLSTSQSDNETSDPAPNDIAAVNIPTRPPPDLTSRTGSHHGTAASDSVEQERARPANRSRARAFSFLSVHPTAPPPNLATSPSLSYASEAPFAGGAYDFALDDTEDDILGSDTEAGAENAVTGDSGRRSSRRNSIPMHRLGSGLATLDKAAYRVQFEPLDTLELAWMAASAFVVLALTVGSLVIAFVG
jgi:hypothetical protein